MFQDIQTLFYENVLVPYKEYRDARLVRVAGRYRDLRLGLAAAASAYHFREHLRPPNAIERKDVIATCPEFALLGDVVNASKHGELTKGNPDLAEASAINELIMVTEYADDAGSYQAVDKAIELTLKDGTKRLLHQVLRPVVNFWIGHLHSRSLIGFNTTFTESQRVAPTREEAGAASDGAAQLDLEIVQGLPFQPRFQLLKFVTSGEVSLVNSVTGDRRARCFTLSIVESTKLSQCRSEDERTEAMKGFATVRSALDELRAELNLPRAPSPPNSST